MKFLSVCIIVSLVYSTCFGFSHKEQNIPAIEALKRKYPHATIKLVTVEEYAIIKQKLTSSGVELNELPGSYLVASNFDKEDETADTREEKPEPEKESSSYQRSPISSVDFDLIISGSGSSDDAAVIIFIAIAVFAVVALAFYAGKFIYDVASKKGDRYGYWFETSFISSAIMSNVEEGSLFGIKVTTGFKDASTHVGLAVDMGSLDVKLDLENKEELAVKGGYVVIGPTIRWHFSTHQESTYYHIDLLAGTTEHKEVGVLSVARTGFNFAIYKNLRSGISIGSMLLNLKESEGLIRKDNNFNMIGSIEFGYRF